MGEIWKDLEPDYPNYEISDRGRARNKKTEKILKPIKSLTHSKKYEYYVLSERKVRKSLLVARAFLPNFENYKKVRHLNGITKDDRVENLKWVEHLRKEKKIYSNPLYQMDDKGGIVLKWNSTKEASETLGIEFQDLKNAVNTGSLFCKHYWRYCYNVDIIEGESWKKIPMQGYTAMASSSGRVKNSKGKIIPKKYKDGHKQVSLEHDETKKKTDFRLDLLMELTFNEKYKEKSIKIKKKIGYHDEKGQIIEIFPTLKAAEKKMHTSHHTIKKSCTTTDTSFEKHRWRYV